MVSPIRLGGEEPRDIEPIEPDVPPPPPSPGAIIKPRKVVTPPTFKGGDFSNGLIDNDDDDITIDVDKTTGEVVISHTEEIVKTPGTYDEDGEELTPPVLEYVVRSATFTPLDIIPSSYAETPSREVKSGKIVRRKRLLRNENDEIKVRVEKTGQYDWIPEEEFDEALHKRIYEEFEVELERTEPSKAVMTTGKKSVTIIAAKNILKETILLDTYSKRSIRWNVVLDKMVLKKHGEIIQAYKENGKDKLPFKLPSPTASNMVEVHWYWGASTGDLRIAFDTLKEDIEFPLEIDPTFSFDGSDFKITSAQTEIKTYQQLWPLIIGTNNRYLNGFMSVDSNGVSDHIAWTKTPSPTLDLSDMTDFTIDVKTTNGDASWTLQIRFGQSWSVCEEYTKVISNDVDATYTLTDFVHDTKGSPDMTDVDYLYIRFLYIDSAKAGNVIGQVKDLKFTSPVKTSDMYDDTGRFVIASEDCEGDDSLSLINYKPFGNAVTGGNPLGGTYVEVDSAQKKTGSTSFHAHCDGTNSVATYLNTPNMVDYTRLKYDIRLSNVSSGSHLEMDVRDGASYLCVLYWANNLRIIYGNGAGGSNSVYVNLAANTWYECWVDIDVANDKYRVWLDGVMHPGPNANARGFDNFYTDGVGTALDNFSFWPRAGSALERDWWVDDMTITTGFEDFSALTTPHDIDDICEAVSPAGTDYGRGTWDGDWATNGASITVDNTKAVIGTNSIKGNDLDYIQLISYAYDAVIDISLSTNMRFYCFPETGMTTIRVYLYCTTGGSREISVTVTPNKWNYVDLDINGVWSGWDETGSFNATIYNQLFIMNFTGATSNLDLWIDGFHFYGDPAAGSEWHENSLDIDANAFDQDGIEFFNLNQLKDTTGGGTFTGDAGIEFADVANAGIDNTTFDGTLTLTGTDSDNRVLWNAVGDTNPTNGWTATFANGATLVLTNVTWKYPNYPNFTSNTISFDDVWFDYAKVLLYFGGGTYNKLEKIKVTNAQHASISFACDSALTFREASVDGAKANNVQCNAGVTILFLDSDFDKSHIALLHANAMIVSKNHNKASEYVVATGATGKAISDVSDPYKPNQTYDVDVVAGSFDFDSDLDMVRDLVIASGVTIDNSSGKLLILGKLTNEGTRNDTADDTYLMNYELPLPVSEQIAYELNGKWKI